MKSFNVIFGQIHDTPFSLLKSALERFGEVVGMVADQFLIDEELLLLWTDIDGDSLRSRRAVVQVSMSGFSDIDLQIKE